MNRRTQFDPELDPSLADIAQRTAQIRESWTPDEEQKRNMFDDGEPYTVPLNVELPPEAIEANRW